MFQKAGSGCLREENHPIDPFPLQGRDLSPPTPQDHEKGPIFPKYKEYEVMPGDMENQQNGSEDRWKEYKNPYMKENQHHITHNPNKRLS